MIKPACSRHSYEMILVASALNLLCWIKSRRVIDNVPLDKSKIRRTNVPIATLLESLLTHVVLIIFLCFDFLGFFFLPGHAWERIANDERNGTLGPALRRVLSLSLKKSFFVYADITINEKERIRARRDRFLGKVKLRRVTWKEAKK